AGAKAGHSDPVVLYGRAIAQRIKGTPGITGLFLPRVHIDGGVWHLDVGSSHPGAVAGPKGSAVRRLKWYASWVQNVDNTAYHFNRRTAEPLGPATAPGCDEPTSRCQTPPSMW